jgi:hypothetical protein
VLLVLGPIDRSRGQGGLDLSEQEVGPGEDLVVWSLGVLGISQNAFRISDSSKRTELVHVG